MTAIEFGLLALFVIVLPVFVVGSVVLGGHIWKDNFRK